MAGSSIIGNATIDIDKIRDKLRDLGTVQNITININSRDVLNEINNISTKLDSLVKGPHEISLTINSNILDQIQDIQQQLGNLGNQGNNNNNNSRNNNNRRRNNNGRNGGGGNNNNNPPTSFPVSRRQWAQKYMRAANAEEQQAIQSLLGRNATLISTSGNLRFDKTGKETGADWIVNYRNELGKTVRTMLTYNKETDKWRVTGAGISANYEAQTKELQKHEKLYRDLKASAWDSKSQLDKNSPFGQVAQNALEDYNNQIQALRNGQQQYTTDASNELSRLQQQAKLTIDQQKVLRDQERIQRERIKADYLKKVKANSKQLEFEDNVKTNASNLVKNYQEELNRLEKATFSGTESLTGDYAKKAKDQIVAVRDSFDKLHTSVGNSFTEASKVSEDDLKNQINNLKSELKILHDLEYPSSKLAAKNVDVLKTDYGNKINQFKEQLKEAGLESSQFSTKLSALEQSLQTVGKVDRTGTPWAEWKNQFEQLEGEFNKFGSTTEGMAQKLAQSLGDNQIRNISNMWTNLLAVPQELSGSGVDTMMANLEKLEQKYSNIKTQLESGNLTKDQFTNLTLQVKELDEQLKQVQNSAKIFQDGFKNEQGIQKYNLDVDNLTQRFERLKQKYDEFVEANPSKANGNVEDMMSRFADSLKNVDPSNISVLTKEFRNLNTAVNNTVNPTQSLAQILQQNFGGVGQYLSRFVTTTFAITKTLSTIKSMVNEVRSLDTSLMELQKVTTLSGDSLAQFTDKAYEVGKDVGRTGKDVIDAVTTFSRAGYTLDESTELAKSALAMSNVGVDIPNMESAASDMISIMKAYDVQVEDSMLLIDKLYNVANKEPLDFGNITDMLVTAGGTLAQTGTSLEETMGLLTGGYATLRDNSVANG